MPRLKSYNTDTQLPHWRYYDFYAFICDKTYAQAHGPGYTRKNYSKHSFLLLSMRIESSFTPLIFHYEKRQVIDQVQLRIDARKRGQMKARKKIPHILRRMSHKCQINIDYTQPNKLISVYNMSNNHGRPFLTFVIATEMGVRLNTNTNK